MEKVGSWNYVTSAMLKMQPTATRIMVAGVLITEELAYDVYLPQFRKMLALIDVIVDAHRNVSDCKTIGASGFVLGLRISAPLYMFVTRCRARVMQRKGIGILACWDPLIVAEIGKFIMDVEEAGVPEGIIPQSSRAVITRVFEAPGNGNGKQEALVEIGSTTGRGGQERGPVWKERMNYWQLP